MLDGRPRNQLQLIGGIQAPGPCMDLRGRQSRRPPTPDLLRRGSAPWRGGTVMICSRAKSSQLCFAHLGLLPLPFLVIELSLSPDQARPCPISPNSPAALAHLPSSETATTPVGL